MKEEKEKGKVKIMTRIRLKEDAYICGYEGAFLRYILPDGRESAVGISGNWFEASAEDEDGNDVFVYWNTVEGFDPNDDTDFEYACDWDTPYMVIRDGRNIAEEGIEIDWDF